jgi:hypothetical protein
MLPDRKFPCKVLWLKFEQRKYSGAVLKGCHEWNLHFNLQIGKATKNSNALWYDTHKLKILQGALSSTHEIHSNGM